MENSIRKVQAHISAALDQWAYIMNDIDAKEKAHLLHYKDEDLLNIVLMFNHVVSNIGIHNGTINSPELGEAFGNDIREFIKKHTGIDTVELTNKVLKNS